MAFGPIPLAVAARGVAFWDSGVTGAQSLAASTSDGERVINALYSKHPWDTAFMAGKQLPGLCEVANGLTEIGIDSKKSDGTDGSTLTVKGYKPGKFEIHCTVWTEEQWAELQVIIRTVWRRAGKNSKLEKLSFEVSHPALQLLGVHSAVVQAVSYPQPGKFEGSKVVTFKCLEHVPTGRKHVTVTPDATTVVKELSNSAHEKESLNFTPARPSTQAKTTGPRGPKAAPESGHA